jgi:hypothetical protein
VLQKDGDQLAKHVKNEVLGYIQSRKKGTYNIQQKEGRLTELVTSRAGTAC